MVKENKVADGGVAPSVMISTFKYEKEAEECQSDALCQRLSWTLLALKMEGATSQRMGVVFTNWKRQGKEMDSSPELSEKNAALPKP